MYHQQKTKHLLIVRIITTALVIYSSLPQRAPLQHSAQFSHSIPVCNCFCSLSPEGNQIYLKSTCSEAGTQYQSNQNVISFSLYFPDPIDPKLVNFYTEGVQLNLENMRQHYPNYSMRIYTDTTLENNSAMCHLYCKSDDLFWWDVRKTPGYGDLSQMFFMTWRFLPLGDPSVDIFLSRDLDSVISPRETAVVQDWLHLKPSKAIHVMRDKQGSHDTPILGGMWGPQNSLLGNISKNLQQKIVRMAKIKEKVKGIDQVIIKNVVFYPHRQDLVAYDSYHCKMYGEYTKLGLFQGNEKIRVAVSLILWGTLDSVEMYTPWCRVRWNADQVMERIGHIVNLTFTN